MINNTEVAESISDLMLKIGKDINESIILVQAECSPDEFSAYKLAAGKVMGEILLEIMNPIYEMHPDIIPDELK
ncbi:hypothetical protein I2494_09065 [Budviciaceae bacterium BWR-B9]|uniref:Cytoplasmic protein n=1 Tax=Limnobaculum allomyrinae TaxID=2791986 RepID=A0ABS1IQN1_9GAMM|nr:MULTISPECIES: hypothetical protein [Limnobaculum]MBK5143866.1 hypothetical protein [Limnobaculum allomyrinae]MBV7691524.1 hypothetical protein [Limnobaculum sp. M2-1]